MPFMTKCPGCGKGLQVPDGAAGKRVKCPDCGHVWQVAAPGAGASQAAERPKAPAPMSKCPGCGKEIQVPESMAGKRVKCPACSHIWQVPGGGVDAEAVPELPALTSRFDDLMSDSYPLATDRANAGGPAGQADASAEAPRRPCPMCGEMIVQGAAKCRFCNAIFDETLKRAEKKKRRRGGGNPDDDHLSALDWVLCVIPLNIACIVGLVYMIMGKPKGIKMIGIAIVIQLAEGFAYGFVTALMHGPR
jgi:predicted RNA-binding Zn-ribbon protein involved in translation (DUF1610 family)